MLQVSLSCWLSYFHVYSGVSDICLNSNIREGEGEGDGESNFSIIELNSNDNKETEKISYLRLV